MKVWLIYDQACKGLRTIYSSAKVMLVPIKEMTDVLSVESKTIEIARDTWVRMKLGIYKGDLAKVCCIQVLFTVSNMYVFLTSEIYFYRLLM